MPYHWWVDEEIVVYINNGVLLIHKENEIMLFVGKWDVHVKEVSQAQYKKSHVLPHLWNLDQKGQWTHMILCTYSHK